MKQIIKAVFALAMLLMTVMTASAYKVTVKWNNAAGAEIRLGSMNAEAVSLAAGQTSYVLEGASAQWIYVVAKDGYKIDAITGPANMSQADKTPIVSGLIKGGSGSYWGKYISDTTVGNWGENIEIAFTLSPIVRDKQFTINVENGASYISAVFGSNNYSVALSNGMNTVKYDPGFDQMFMVMGDNGVTKFFKITWNGTNVDPVFNQYRLYDIEPGNEVVIRVFEGDEPVKEEAVITVSLPAVLKDAVKSVRNWTTSKWIDMTDNKISINKGDEIAINFNTEDYTYTGFSFDGTDLMSSFSPESGKLRWTVAGSGTLTVSGGIREYGKTEFKVYAINGEGVSVYTEGFGNGAVRLENGTVLTEDIRIKDYTLRAGVDKVYTVLVSERYNSLFVSPVKGWYIATVQVLEGDLFEQIDGITDYDDYRDVYIVAEKYEENASVVFDVRDCASSIRLSGNRSLDQNWSNPQATFELTDGKQTLNYVYGYSNPMSLRIISNGSLFAYNDGVKMTADDYGSYSIEPYYNAEDKDRISTFTVATSALPITNVIFKGEGLDAELTYGTARQKADSGINLIEGTLCVLKPSKADCTVTLNGNAVDLDADGEYKFTTTGTKMEFLITDKSGISEVIPDQYNHSVYSVDGRLISRSADRNVLKGLPAGVYIVNGTKYIVH